MFWNIVAWMAVVLLFALRFALVIAIVAVVWLVVKALRQIPVNKPRHISSPGRK